MYKKDTYTYTYSCTHDQAVDVLINDVKALGFYPKETKATDDACLATQRGLWARRESGCWGSSLLASLRWTTCKCWSICCAKR